MATKWPSVAYHFHVDDEVTIADAIEMREGDDPRAGDIWCHAECYKGEPRTGNRLFPVNLPSCPYFRRGKGSYTRVVDCEFERVMLSKGESYRFAQFYHDLLVWLNSGEGKENPSELFHISGVGESKLNVADIVISHTEKAPIDWTETRIIIVDKNRRRKASNEHTLVIDITHWTDSQLADFSNSGIRKMIDEWNQLLARHESKKQKDGEAEKEGSDQPEPLNEREIELLQLIKQHRVGHQLTSTGDLTSFEYRLLDGPKGDTVLQNPISDYSTGWRFSSLDPQPPPLDQYPKIIERSLYQRIESDLVERKLAEWVCRKCMGHHKTYQDCTNDECNYTSWLNDEKDRINRDYSNHRFGKKKRDQQLEKLREREEHNPTTTEYCSLCEKQLKEYFKSGSGLTGHMRCPKCDIWPGIRSGLMIFTPGCDCDQGKVASECETCTGGRIRPDISYLHLKLKCKCSKDAQCQDHRWHRILLVSASDDDPKKLSIVCGCCGFEVFGDDYIVGDREREFWICRSANRMLTDSEFDEFRYGQRTGELEIWFFKPDPWLDYIDG